MNAVARLLSSGVFHRHSGLVFEEKQPINVIHYNDLCLRITFTLKKILGCVLNTCKCFDDLMSAVLTSFDSILMQTKVFACFASCLLLNPKRPAPWLSPLF
jgi:hypothetical protein